MIRPEGVLVVAHGGEIIAGLWHQGTLPLACCLFRLAIGLVPVRNTTPLDFKLATFSA
jgi:hypothetical protein